MRAGIAAAVFALALIAQSAWAQPQTYPNRPIRLIVGLAPGGTQDLVARTASRQVATQVGQNIVIDNRDGATGIIATDLVAKSAPDGYTMLHASSDFVINSLTHRKLPYDINRDFSPVTIVVRGAGYLLLAHPSVPAQSLKDFIALARKPDSRLTFGSGGVGNLLHLTGELFNARAGTHMTHVPYKGGAPAVNAIIAGEIQSLFVPPTPTVLQQIKAGRLRALGFTGAARWQFLPDVPTVAEAGVPGFVISGSWHGWIAPAHTPRNVIAKIQAETQKAMQVPAVREPLIAAGYEPAGSTTEEFLRSIRADAAKYGEAVRAAKIKAE